MARGSAPARLALVLVLALVPGCLGGSPRPQFFTLSPASGPGAGPALASLPDLGLVVGPLDLPRFLDRPELVTRDGAYHLVVADAERWGGSLRSDILHGVADGLSRLLGTALVAVYPGEPRFSARYRILLDVRELDAVRGEKVTLRLRWTVASLPDGRAVAVEESVIEQPVASGSFEELVAAESAALGAATRQIAERIAQLSAS